MANLSKQFVYVSGASAISTFKTKHTGASITAEDAYYKKIVFLGDTGEVATHGTVFATNFSGDLNAIKTILAGFGTEEGEVANVTTAIATAKSEAISTLRGENDTVENNTLALVSARIKTIEDLISDDEATEGDTIDRLREVLNWFASVSTTDTGAILIQDVAANKSAIGTKAVAAQGTEGEEGYVAAKAATGLYKYVDDAVEAANSSADDAIKALDVTDNASDAVAGISVKVDEVDGKVSKPVVSVTGGSVADGDTSVVTGGTVYTAIKGAIEDLDVTDAAEDGKYVSSVSQEDGKITVTRADLPTLSVKTGSGDYVAVDGHEIEIKTVDISDAVGMTKNQEGKWVQGDASSLSNGLANAADVAAEIVADELVIATALNDHESRIADLESAAPANGSKTGKDDETSPKVTVKVDTTAGTVSGVTVTTDDIASAALLGTASDDSTKATAFGKAAAAQADVDALETAVGTSADTKESDTVYGAIATVQDNLDTLESAVEEWDMWGTYTEETTTE